MRRVLPAPALKLWWIVAVWADALFVVPCSSSYCTMVAVGPCLEMRVRMCMHDVFVRHGVAWSKEKQKRKPKKTHTAYKSHTAYKKFKRIMCKTAGPRRLGKNKKKTKKTKEPKLAEMLTRSSGTKRKIKEL